MVAGYSDDEAELREGGAGEEAEEGEEAVSGGDRADGGAGAGGDPHARAGAGKGEGSPQSVDNVGRAPDNVPDAAVPGAGAAHPPRLPSVTGESDVAAVTTAMAAVGAGALGVLPATPDGLEDGRKASPGAVAAGPCVPCDRVGLFYDVAMQEHYVVSHNCPEVGGGAFGGGPFGGPFERPFLVGVAGAPCGASPPYPI